MTIQGIRNKPARTACMFALCISLFLAGCLPTGQRDGAGSVTEKKLEARVVCVRTHAELEPPNLCVQPGTVVVWLNQSADGIRIVFPERKVTIACLSPVSFMIHDGGFFESKVLAPGAIASLCFVQPGSYAYVIERQADAQGSQPEWFRLEGSITVQ